LRHPRLSPRTGAVFFERERHANVRQGLRAQLDRWMRETGDPRAAGDDDRWDRFPYYGAPAK
jgi:hypothetical protein